MNKVDECPDKVTLQIVNEDEEWPNVCHSSQICQPTEQSLESHDQQAYGRKRKPEGEEDLNDCPAQCLWARMAKLAVAMELLIGDHEFKINEQAHATHKKAGIRLPKSYGDAVNDPIYGSKW